MPFLALIGIKDSISLAFLFYPARDFFASFHHPRYPFFTGVINGSGGFWGFFWSCWLSARQAAGSIYAQVCPKRLEASLPSLSGRVEIVRDTDDILHIFAMKDADAFFVLGYVHAHYDDLLERLQAVEYLSMAFGRENVTRDALTLQPK